jgi:hypothetical protein
MDSIFNVNGREVLTINNADKGETIFQGTFEELATRLIRLKEYEEAIEQGLMIELPCKAGTPIVRIIKHCTHVGDFFFCDGCERRGENGYCIPYLWERGFAYCDIGDFGKTVFLTREEAEAALKEASHV